MDQTKPRTDWPKGEIAVADCSHTDISQFAGWNAYRDSHYKCRDCGAVKIVPCGPQEATLEFGEVV